MLDVFLDALKDSAIVLAIVFAVYVILAFIEPRFSHKMEHAGRLAPLLGGAIGLIPQCGFSVVAADLYRKKHITLGTLIAVFVATSDEALPIFFSNPDKMIYVLPLLGVKLVVGVGMGYLIDLLYRQSVHQVHHHEEECECQPVEHVGCCHHHIEGEERPNKWKQYLLHPLLHSLKIFAYVFVINMIFQTILYYVGQDKVIDFLMASRYAAPAIAVLVGLIPNCASSVMLADLFMLGGLSFGACVGGLCVNAGLGLMILYKDVKQIKNSLVVTAILIAIGLSVGYIICAITGFGA